MLLILKVRNVQLSFVQVFLHLLGSQVFALQQISRVFSPAYFKGLTNTRVWHTFACGVSTRLRTILSSIEYLAKLKIIFHYKNHISSIRSSILKYSHINIFIFETNS